MEIIIKIYLRKLQIKLSENYFPKCLLCDFQVAAILVFYFS
jgi:hypothetical protein